MKFGKVEDPENIDFTIPPIHPDTLRVLKEQKSDDPFTVYVGCPNWNKANLKGFYPRGTKDELEYYSRQFNSIELNATFYRNFPATQFHKWYEKTPTNFKFFPKLGQEISHWKRLKGVEDITNSYIDNFSNLREKLGTIFIQMNANFGPNNFEIFQKFVESWPKGLPLAFECRHKDWFSDEKVSKEYFQLLEEYNMTNILVDTAGRRDMMHMRLTTNEAFIRFVGANHTSDYSRLDDWIVRLKEWRELGLNKIHFFIHENLEKESPMLAQYFIKQMNTELGIDLKIPNKDDSYNQESLF